MKRWLHEPLLHFLLAGALLFAAYAWLNRERESGPREVRIGAAEINWLKETWTRQWQRPPTEEELRGLVADFLKEDLLAREARELKLDENDTIVRRRLAQKMRFVIEDTATLAEPTDDELRRLLAVDAAAYQAPARINFSQLYFKTGADAQAALKRLAQKSAGDTGRLGENTLLERDYAGLDAAAVTSVFGPKFAERLFAVDTGGWQGPLASGYGFHLVFVTARQPPQARPFAELRPQLRAEWQRRQQAQASEKYFAELLKKYAIVADDSVRPLLGSLAKGQP
ncbi:peptidyl-prolyl cis-trans isomerase [Sulfurisoma sediminicola]|uniref:peptidylprolyl isomerase n=1 Tax=Sulfurisoma sediminicola TaxID=1381557 RepID=A0A497XAE3_9PROT|nr:peptidylprolyl isomerase [Sulfurisoma sediminicola]RLJ63496.1 parvulin-like peptidyl-prolyl cis-trans isomerase protein [Sulfurisoma sediminicola]